VKFACPQCSQEIDLRRGVCPGCHLPLTLGAVVKFYWSFWYTRCRQTAVVPCTECGGGVPITAKACPACKTPLTVNSAVEKTLAPARQRAGQLVAGGRETLARARTSMKKATPETKRRIQWVYLLFSVALLWWLLVCAEQNEVGTWLRRALLSVVFLAASGMLVIVVVPRHMLQTVSRRASILSKLAMVANYLTLLLLLQMMIGVWWQRALILAGLVGVTCLGAWLLTVFWNATEKARNFIGQDNQTFDPSAPQGRQGRFD
jgi:hypothetical protein